MIMRNENARRKREEVLTVMKPPGSIKAAAGNTSNTPISFENSNWGRTWTLVWNVLDVLGGPRRDTKR
jgi:hypothetical protein